MEVLVHLISLQQENLGLQIGADIQEYDADLADISALSQVMVMLSFLMEVIGRSNQDLTQSISSLGSDVQAYDEDLADLADGTLSASKVENSEYFITSAGTANQVWTSDGSGAGS